MEGPPVTTVRPPERVDDETREWLRSLRGEGAERDAAIVRLHALLLHAARFEVSRRRTALPTSAATSSPTSPPKRPTTR